MSQIVFFQHFAMEFNKNELYLNSGIQSMNKRFFQAKALVMAGIIILMTSCRNEFPQDQQSDGRDSLSLVSFIWDHTVDGAGVVYNDIRYANAAGNRYSVMTLRYFISDIMFHRYDGSVARIDTFHYRDIEKPETRRLTVAAPDGEYAYISFYFGLDSIKNKSYGLPPTRENNNMEWPEPMGGGYHYMKFEGRYLKSTGDTASFNTHTGRLFKDEKMFENFIHVELPYSSIALEGNDWEIQVVMNLNDWYRYPNKYNIEAFGPGIMSNQEAQEALKENGKHAFKIGYLSKSGSLIKTVNHKQ